MVGSRVRVCMCMCVCVGVIRGIGSELKVCKQKKLHENLATSLRAIATLVN